MTSRTARQRRSRLQAVPLLTGLLVAGCLHGEEPRGGSVPTERDPRAPSGTVTVTRGRPADIAYIAGARAYGVDGRGRPVRLAAAADSTLLATLSPAGLLDPTRRFLTYNAWDGRGPAIRLHELGMGTDRVLAGGAFSLAWRADGSLAYVKLLRARLYPRRERPRGHIVARAEVGAPGVRWTERARHYVVAAWARERLLAYRVPRAKGRWPDLLIFDAPGRVRVLARRSGLVALSPDARQAFVTEYGASPPIVRVLSVATGVEEARLRLRDGRGAERLRWVTESGSWTGELVAAKADPGLAVFHVSGSEISLEQVLRIDPAMYPLGVFEPHIDRRASRISMWAQRAQQPRDPLPDATLLSCDRLELRCVEAANVAVTGELRFMFDPSRP